MKLSLYKILEKLIWILTVFVLASYIVFESYSWSRYVFLGASLAIVLLTAILSKGRLIVKFETFQGFLIAFCGFSVVSSLWAINAGDAIQKGVTLAQILICATMMYLHYQNEESVQKLLKAVMWAGYIVAIYAIVFYGLDTLMTAAEGNRIENDFSNVNSIGMAAAICSVFQVHEWGYRKSWVSAIFIIPCIVVIAASQSRKAFVLLILGSFVVYFARKYRGKNLTNTIIKVILALIVAFCIAVVLYNLPVFAGVRERMDSMIIGLMGSNATDNSTRLRMNMIELGLQWFVKHPLVGVGIGNAHILAAQHLGIDTYLHNNYAELLCSGGIIGFSIYYGMYFYLFRNLWRHRGADQKHFTICFVWLAMMLIMDYGMVTYSSKEQWFYLMVQFLNVFCLKKKSMELKYANKKTAESRA